MSQNIIPNANHANNVAALKAARTHQRTSTALVLALWGYLDKASLSDSQKERARNASATIGAKMLAAKNALPSEPNQLRMHVEAIKQKCEAINASLSDEKSFSNHCQSSAIKRACNAALENVKVFIAEYVEHKANVASAKAA